MSLGSGESADTIMAAKVGGPEEVRQSLESLLNAGATIGQALRALRESQGLTLNAIAETTCVRRAYLQAVEDMAIDQLPSGPFAVGYVRAYAQMLGASSDLAAAKFREFAPTNNEALKAPMGVRRERDPRLSWLAGVCAVVVTSVVLWNVAQHAVAHDGGPTPPAPVTNTPAAKPLTGAPVALGAALPAPADNDVPTPYVTPGMAKATGGPDFVAAPPVPVKHAPLNPRAAVYGAPAGKSAVTLRATKAASLVIRGADGSIYFARQLSAGESFRAPANIPGLTVDVSDPQAWNVIVNGQAAAPLTAAQTPVSKLLG